MSEPRTSVVRRLGLAGVLGVLSMTLPLAGSAALFWAIAKTSLGGWLKAHPAEGVSVYVLGLMVLCGLALLPTTAEAALGGWAFGMAVGAPAAIGAFTGAAALAYALARRASGDRVEGVIEENPRWKAVRDALAGPKAGSGRERAGFWRTTGMVTLIRLPPNSPFAFMNLLMASVKVPFGAYLLGTLVGMAPRTMLAVMIGAGIQEAMTGDALREATPKWVVWGGVVGVVVVLIVLGAIANRAIERVTKAGTRAS